MRSRTKKEVSYMVQTNTDGSYDIVQCTAQNKIVANTSNVTAAEEIMKTLNNIKL